jgi:hypothetical protein
MIYTDGTKLYSTHIAELHEFANTIGLPAKLYVEDGLICYYHIGSGNIALLKAIANGAECIKPEEIKYTQRTFLAPPPHGIHN